MNRYLAVTVAASILCVSSVTSASALSPGRRACSEACLKTQSQCMAAAMNGDPRDVVTARIKACETDRKACGATCVRRYPFE